MGKDEAGRERTEEGRRAEEGAEGGAEEERGSDECGNGGRERSGNVVEVWPGYEAEVLELRRKRQRELDALNAPRVPDYARWKPPGVGGEQDGKEGVEDEGATGAQADVPEAISGGNGEVFIEGSVTPLTLEDQGERANIQNESSQLGTGDAAADGEGGGRLPGDGGDGSCDGEVPCQWRVAQWEMEWDEEISRKGAKTQREGREGRDLVTASEDG